MAFAEAQVMQRSSTFETALVRQGHRYGLCTDHTHTKCKSQKLLHLRPESNALFFWTQCLALRIRTGLLQQADEVPMEAQPNISKVVHSGIFKELCLAAAGESCSELPFSQAVETVRKA